MATDSRKHRKRGPAPPKDQRPTPPALLGPEPSAAPQVPPTTDAAPAPAKTLLDLVDRATDKPLKAILLLLLVCCPIIIVYSPAIIAAVLAAIGVAKPAITYITVASNVASASVTTGTVIALMRRLKNLTIPAQDDGNQTSRPR